MSYYETTYGEIVDTTHLYQIIENHGSISCKEMYFYDFGSGYGNIVLQFQNKFQQSIGIELVKDRYDHAVKQNKFSNVNFIWENFFHIFLQNPCVILVNNLCLGTGTNKRLGCKLLNEMKSNDILMVTKKIKSLELYYITYYNIQCSWGRSELYVYKIE